MRTIKRKRLFTKRTSRKSIRRKKLFRKILQRGGQIDNPLGKLNSEPISQLPENDDSIAEINAPTHFTGNITKVGNRIELSNFEEKKSRKLGWMYGQYIGNFNIVLNENDKVSEIKSMFANNNSVVKNSLFIPPLDDKIKISEKYSPWKTRLYDIDVSLIDGNCETTMKKILVDFYNSKLKHRNPAMIEYIIEKSEDGILNGSIISKDNIHERYLPGLLDRNLYDKDKGLVYSDLDDKTWTSITEDDRENLNAFRLKQQIFMRNTIDIFSEYNEYIIPFNMEYYRGFNGANIECITFLENYFAYLDIYKSNKSIDNGLLSKIIQISLSSMLCNFSKVHTDGGTDIFSKFKGGMFSQKNSNIRTKKSTDVGETFEIDADNTIQAVPSEKYVDFEYRYYINSLITPKILTELLLYNIIIKKMIILEKEEESIKLYKEQKTSDFLDAMGRGEEHGFNKHFKDLYILRKLQEDPFSESQLSEQSPYNIAREDKTQVKSWYDDMKKTERKDRKYTYIKIEKDVKNANGDITKVSTPYLYQIEENDKYMCIYVLNEKLYNDLILKDDLGNIDIKAEKHLKNFNAIADKKDIFNKYFENLLSKQSMGHTSRLYTLTPEAS